MVALYYQFDTFSYADSHFVAQRSSPLPVGFLPARLALINARLAVIASAPEALPTRDAFLQHVRETYLPLDGASLAGGLGALVPALRALQCPALIDLVRVFDSEAALEAYVRDPAYKLPFAPNGPSVYAAIVFNRAAPGVDYTIRVNQSDAPNTRSSVVDILQRGSDLGAVRRLVASTPQQPGSGLFVRPSSVSNAALLQPFPGFMTLQLAVDRFLLNRSLTAPEAAALLDPTSVVAQLLLPSLVAVVPYDQIAALAPQLIALQVTFPQYYAQLVAELAGFFRAERLAPQKVDLVAFPVPAYQTNGFYGTVLGLFAFFFIVVVLFPVARLIRCVVLEKETKQREGMRMMGLSDAAWSASWSALYGAFFAIIALLIAAMTSSNIFRYSGFGFVFAYFFLFGLACVSYAQLIAVFFSASKTASTVGVVIFLGG
jgi:hypothetical protein